MTTQTIGVIGVGHMGWAILSQLAKQAGEHHLMAAIKEPREGERITHLADELGIAIPVTQDANELARACDLIILAVKPDIVGSVLSQIARDVTPGSLILSVAAGVTLEALAHSYKAGGGRADQALVRAMPNINAQVGHSATSLTFNPQCTPEHHTLARNVISAVGTVIEVPEHLVDVVVGVSGSGPAWMFMMVEGLTQGAVELGMKPDDARTLAISTMLGSAVTMQETGIHPAVLRDQVCSPGGTTIAGANALMHNGFISALIKTVTVTAERAHALGEEARAKLVD